jgi:hypothetical protein
MRPMKPAAPKFLRTWGIAFLLFACLPTVLALLLLLIPGGQMLALVPAFILSVPGALLIGPPHFSAEFGIPMSGLGVLLTFVAWVLICAFIAAGVTAYTHVIKREPSS